MNSNVNSPPQSQNSINEVNNKMFCEDHLTAIEGVRLSMEVLDSKIPNHMGYSYLILTKSCLNLAELSNKTQRK
jgi:hypothetical protein